MKIHIPNIGDSLVLKKDWKFTLYADFRNVKLAEFYGYYLFNSGWVSSHSLPIFTTPELKVDYPDYNDFKKDFGKYDEVGYRKACIKAEEKNPEYIKYIEAYNKWIETAKNLRVTSIPVIIKKNTELIMDKFCIHKGEEEYSHLLFYARGLGKEARRFWASLEECNNIEI